MRPIPMAVAVVALLAIPALAQTDSLSLRASDQRYLVEEYPSLQTADLVTFSTPEGTWTLTPEEALQRQLDFLERHQIDLVQLEAAALEQPGEPEWPMRGVLFLTEGASYSKLKPAPPEAMCPPPFRAGTTGQLGPMPSPNGGDYTVMVGIGSSSITMIPTGLGGVQFLKSPPPPHDAYVSKSYSGLTIEFGEIVDFACQKTANNILLQAYVEGEVKPAAR